MEADTLSFIAVWTEYYPKLTSGGSRHTAIYNAMAEQLNEILSPRYLTGAEVKSKVGNLMTEYRRKKKAQGKTGASPCTWPYYDVIDKLLGKLYSISNVFYWTSLKSFVWACRSR